MINNRLYDILVWVTMIVLPAIGTLYFTLAGIWGFPYAEEITGTITAIVTFLGVVLKISNAKYKKNQTDQTEE
nr:MAG TPA: holin [Caudoviricetes sp.]